MSAVKFTCPQCKAVLRVAKALPEGTQIKCVKCQNPILILAGMQSDSTGASFDGTTPSPLKAGQAPAANRASASSAPGSRPVVNIQRRKDSSVGVILFVLFLFLLLGGGGGAAVYFLVLNKSPKPALIAEGAKKNDPTTTVPVKDPETKKDPEPINEPPVKPPAKKIDEQPKPEIKKPEPKKPLEKKLPEVVKDDPQDNVLAPKKEVRIKVDQAKINKAIDEGVKFLRDTVEQTGTWKADEMEHYVGHAALPALALLECKEPPDSPAIQKAAGFVRKHAVNLNKTYDIGCAILFLDKLNDPQDRALLKSLAMRLIAGQTESGAWSYECPILNVNEGNQLFDFLEKTRPKIELMFAVEAGPDVKQPAPKIDPNPKPPVVGKTPALPPKLAELPVVKFQKAPDPEQYFLTRGDNSNTQFAILGLWTARKHGVPVERNIDFAAKHFQKTQNGDGGWPYVSGRNPTKNTMTCVGLLGLAMGHGAAAEAFQDAVAKGMKSAKPPVEDPNIKEALLSLAKYLDGDDKEIRGLESRIDIYFLWGIERVGMLYQRDTFGKRDWYQWGAEEILKRQEPDGRWDVHYHASIDTSFALMFLARSNLVRNLTDNLQFYLAIPQAGK